MTTDPNKLIIRKPGARAVKGKILSWFLSLGLWWGFAHWIRIFLAALGWGAAWGISSAIAGRMRAMTVLHAAMIIYMPEILGLVLLLWGWAFYNWLRFHGEGNKRRMPPPPLTLEETSRAFSLSPHLVRQAKDAKIEVFRFDDKGNIQSIESKASLADDKPQSRDL